jgi:hypothetical protein
MRNLIESIIVNKGDNYFEFHSNSDNPVGHLKEQTNSVPKGPGIYLVFTQKEDVCEKCAHLNYEIEGIRSELLYFGKAGGLTKNSGIIKQGLNGRINNVVSDSSRNLRDIRRANYWNIVMNEFGFEIWTIIYHEHSNPQDIENTFYNFLDINNLKYPLLNKRRGKGRGR